MQTVKFLFLAVRDLIAAIFIGAIISLVVVTVFQSMRSSSLFTLWKQLDSPVKFIRISDATAYEVLAISNEDQRYKFNIWDCKLNKKCIGVETHERRLYRDAQTTTVRRDVCEYEDYAGPIYKPGNVVECIFTMQVVAEYNPLVYYAILDDETIWYWLPIPHWNLSSILVFTLIGAGVGAIAGIITVYRKEMNSKYA